MSDPRHEKRVLYTDQPNRGVNRFNQALKFAQILIAWASLALRFDPQPPMTPPRLRNPYAFAALHPGLRVTSQPKTQTTMARFPSFADACWLLASRQHARDLRYPNRYCHSGSLRLSLIPIEGSITCAAEGSLSFRLRALPSPSVFS